MGCSSRRKAKRQKRTPRASKKSARLIASAAPPLCRLASPRLELRRALRRAFQNTGLPVGFIADSIGATVGAAAAFLLGRTIGRSFVVSKLNDYPQFQAVAIATQKSGFKIIFLLRLVPIIPFNMLNYALSVTPIPLGKYILASWLGMMPVTLALVYIGTTLRDLSDVTHGWHDFSKAHWALIITGLVVSVVVLICVTIVAKDALERALAENEDINSIAASPELSIVADPTADLHQPLMITINQDDHEN